MSDNNEQKVKTPQQIEAERIYPNWYTEYDEGRAYNGFLRGTHYQMERMGHLHVTVGELQSENIALKLEVDKLREALKEIKKLDEWGDYRQISIEAVRIAEQALR